MWTVAGAGSYTGKPRPAVIVQDDRFDQTASVTIVPMTSDLTEAPLIRLVLQPTESNGLETPSALMVDKVTTVPKSRLGRRVGRLSDEDMVRLTRALVVFLGVAGAGTA